MGRHIKKDAKHRIMLNNEKLQEFMAEIKLKGLRSKNLQKLVLIWTYAGLGQTSPFPLSQEIHRRLSEKKLGHNREDIAYEINPKDIMTYLNCSYRTAQDYVYAIRALEG